MTKSEKTPKSQPQTLPSGHPRKVSPNTVEQYQKFIQVYASSVHAQKDACMTDRANELYSPSCCAPN